MAVDQLSSVFMALADPTRRAILTRLMAGDANVSELAEPFSISQPAISKHLKVLERAGLISRSRAATARLSHLEAAPLQEATIWMENYRQYWDSSFDRLDDALTEYMAGKAAQGEGAKRAGIQRVDGKGGAP
jgi:DNA-binding transcriptional ArsR family regulator